MLPGNLSCWDVVCAAGGAAVAILGLSSSAADISYGCGGGDGTGVWGHTAVGLV